MTKAVLVHYQCQSLHYQALSPPQNPNSEDGAAAVNWVILKYLKQQLKIE